MNPRDFLSSLADAILDMTNGDFATRVIAQNLWVISRQGRNLQAQELAQILLGIGAEVAPTSVTVTDEGGSEAMPEFQGITEGQARLVLAKIAKAGARSFNEKLAALGDLTNKNVPKDTSQWINWLMANVDQKKDLPQILERLEKAKLPG